MVSYDEFVVNSGVLVELLYQIWKENIGSLPFPCTVVGATLSNFKPISVMKQPSKKLESFFTKQGPIDKVAAQQKKENDIKALNEEIKLQISKKRALP